MSKCNEINDPCESQSRTVEPWSVCLPWGGRLWSDGFGVYAQGGNPPPDGVYGKVVISNGCLVGVESEDVPLYTGSPCSPDPGGCGGNAQVATAAAMDSGIEPSPVAGNLYKLDAAGLPLVKVSIETGAGLSVSGDGTLSNPYVIEATAIGIERVYMRSDNAAIAVTGDGSYQNPFVVAHKKGLQKSANGLVFDTYGHLVDVTSGSANKGVQGVIGGAGLTAVTDETGTVTVSMDAPPNALMGDYTLGGFKITLDNLGKLWNITQDINLGAAYTVQWGTNIVSLNQYGSVTDIEETTNPGCCYDLVWPQGQSATRRYGTIDLAYTSALAGVLYTAGNAAFINGLHVLIDGSPCVLGYGGGAPELSSSNVQYFSLPFTGNGLYVRGEHNVEIVADIPWEENCGAAIFLWASQPGTVGEE